MTSRQSKAAKPKSFGSSAVATTNQELLAKTKETMLASGRCPHQVDYLSKVYNLESFVFLSKLPPLPLRQAMHRRCAEHQSCVAFNTDEQAYRPSHICAGGDCALVEVDQEALAKTIRAGKIPLLSMGPSDDSLAGDTPTLTVHARTRRTKYVAVSHVWADGLGNTEKCALPSCQLRLLQTRLADAYEASSASRLQLGLDQRHSQSTGSIDDDRTVHGSSFSGGSTLCGSDIDGGTAESEKPSKRSTQVSVLPD